MTKDTSLSARQADRAKQEAAAEAALGEALAQLPGASSLDLGKLLQYADLISRVIAVAQIHKTLAVGDAVDTGPVRFRIGRKRFELPTGPLKRIG